MVKNRVEGSGETRLETGISYVLILGVSASLLIEAIGIFLYYREFHGFAISRDGSMFMHGRLFFSYVAHLLRETVSAATPVRLMALGIAVLILTPYARMVMSIAYFAQRRNLKYVLITAFVLVVLTVSLMTH
jgi:uncharacterized membrane protein